LKIRVTGHSFQGVFPFGSSGPWNNFERVLIDRGHTICGNDYSEKADAIIANSFNTEIRDYILNSDIPKERRILVLWEPYIVEKTRYLPKVLELFGSVFAPSIDWADRVNGRAFSWPQDDFTSENVFENWEDRLNQAVMVQGNKFSARKGEQYSLRRRTLSQTNIDELLLFGTNWNKGINFDWWHWSRSLINSSWSDVSLKSLYGLGKINSQYAGESSNKSQTLKNFQISIVIENSSDFISEKLFDSVRAGCLTLFVGPRLDRYGIPNDSAFEVSDDPKEIVALLRRLLQLDISEKKSLAKKQYDALKPISRKWKNSTVLTSVAREMITVLES